MELAADNCSRIQRSFILPADDKVNACVLLVLLIEYPGQIQSRIGEHGRKRHVNRSTDPMMVKRIRGGRNLSLDQLSELTGVSKSMLRQIETGRSSPTIATIWKIANALKLSFTTLLKKPSIETLVCDFKAEKPLTAKSGKYRLYPLVPFDPQRSSETYYVEIDPGADFKGEPHEGNVEEYIFVLKGSLVITVDGVGTEVKKSQFLRFQADRPHQYHCKGKQSAAAIMQICYLS